MAEYLANAEQVVELNQPILFTASIPCNRGYVYHEDETGIFILKGIINNPCDCKARYQVTYVGNVAIPAAGDITPIATAIAVNGEQRPTSRSIYTPAAVDAYGSVISTAIIDVPRGCCFSVSVRYVSGITGAAATVPTPAIEVINSNLVINRIA